MWLVSIKQLNWVFWIDSCATRTTKYHVCHSAGGGFMPPRSRHRGHLWVNCDLFLLCSDHYQIYWKAKILSLSMYYVLFNWQSACKAITLRKWTYLNILEKDACRCMYSETNIMLYQHHKECMGSSAGAMLHKVMYWQCCLWNSKMVPNLRMGMWLRW